MLTAFNFDKAQKAIEEAKGITKTEMPKASFVFIGINNDYIYFNIIAKLSQVTKQEIRDIKEKTRFETIEEHNNNIYKINLKMALY